MDAMVIELACDSVCVETYAPLILARAYVHRDLDWAAGQLLDFLP